MQKIQNSVLLIVLTILVFSGMSTAQDEQVPQVANSYALTGATVVVKPGDTLFNASLFMKDGLIKAIGTDIDIPIYAQQLKCDSLYVYAGFIEGISNTGIPARDNESQGSQNESDENKPVTNADRGIEPERKASSLFESSESSVDGRRKLGFTTSLVVAKDGMLPGTGSLISLGTGPTDELVIKDDICMYARLDPARRIYPGTIIGVIAKFREMYRQAELLEKHLSLYSTAENGVERPRYDKSEAAMIPVVDGQLPVFFYAANSLDMYKAISLHNELGFELVFVESREAWYLEDYLLENPTPVLIALDLPDKIDEQGAQETADSVQIEPKTREQLEKEQLIERRNESRQQHFQNAGVVASTGVPYAFSMLEVKDKDVYNNLRVMTDNGLMAPDVLAALTVNPANLYGVENILGTVEKGKLANIVVTTAPLLDENMEVKYVFVEGRKFEYEPKPKKSSKRSTGENGEAMFTGSWSIVVEIPDDPQTATMEITGDDSNYKGKITPDDGDVEIQMSNITKSGNLVTFDIVIIDGTNNIPANFEIEIDGDLLNGTMTSPMMGSFPVSGERIP